MAGEPPAAARTILAPTNPKTARQAALAGYVSARGFNAQRTRPRRPPGLVGPIPPRRRAARKRPGPYSLTLRSSMARPDWEELVTFLETFPAATPDVLASATLTLELRPHLLDLKDAWKVARMAPADLVALPTFSPTRVAACGILTVCHPAHVTPDVLTLETSLAVPLPLLRDWAGAGTARATVTRTTLVTAANAATLAGHAATADHATLQVTPRHLSLLYDLNPGAPRTMAGVNAWIAATRLRYVVVPRYTRPPRPPALPLCFGSFVQPLWLAHASLKYALDGASAPAVRLRRLAARHTNPTFSFPWPSDAPANAEDCYFTAFADMAAEDYVCWGTLTSHTYVSVAELVGWFTTCKCLARLHEPTNTYNIAQARDLVAVLDQYVTRLERGYVGRPVAVQETSLRALRVLRFTVTDLIDAHARALAMDAETVRRMAALDDAGRSAVLAFFRAVQELAAYCFHWRGPGTPLPRLGDAVMHLPDAIDVETAVYTRGMPPAIDAYAALPPAIRARVGELRMFIKPNEPSAQSITAALEAMQDARGVSARACIRLSARPLWQTACAYAALFFNEALPAYELAV